MRSGLGACGAINDESIAHEGVEPIQPEVGVFACGFHQISFPSPVKTMPHIISSLYFS